MADTRRYSLIDLHPQILEDIDGTQRYLRFECPEPHTGCSHVVPFEPPIRGQLTHPKLASQPLWHRVGDDLSTMTLTPSIRRIAKYKDRAEALRDGCLEEYITDSMFCHLHIFITDGKIHLEKNSG